MFCKHCGKEISDIAKFCASCGGDISVPTSVAPKQAVVEKDLKGLGGWLILVIIGLFVAVGFQVYGAYESITMFTDGTVEFLSDPTSEVYIPSYAGLIKFEFIAGILFLAVGIYLIYLFFRRNKNFPRYYIWFLVASVIYVIVDYALLAGVSVSSELQEYIDEILSEQAGEIGRAVISSLIWIAYMTKSKRVKATFIED